MTDHPLWAEIAFRELLFGVAEIPGTEHSARILEYHKTTGLGASDDETPWCAAFVSWALRAVGIRGTGLANARSFADWGEPCLGRLGGIAVLWRGDPNGWQGHVGFVVGERPGFIRLLGGNQGDRVSIADYPAERLIGYRWPGTSDRIAMGG